MQRIYVGQTGLQVEVQTEANKNGIDLLGATCTVLLKKPDGNIIVYPVELSEGEDVFRFTVADPEDLQRAGVYYLQSRITKIDLEAYGKTAAFEVRELFN